MAGEKRKRVGRALLVIAFQLETAVIWQLGTRGLDGGKQWGPGY